jgi:hypothetical protein
MPALKSLPIAERVERIAAGDQIHLVRCLLRDTLVALLTGRTDDATVCRVEAAYRSTPAMRKRLDIERLYRAALLALPETVDGEPSLPLPETCPITLDALLMDDTGAVFARLMNT